jgi:hypothetical protein
VYGAFKWLQRTDMVRSEDADLKGFGTLGG